LNASVAGALGALDAFYLPLTKIRKPESVVSQRLGPFGRTLGKQIAVMTWCDQKHHGWKNERSCFANRTI